MNIDRSCITFSKTNSIILEHIDLLTASSPFMHVDRIAQMNVMIYVLSGCIYVSEEDKDYEIHEGELILLKKGTHQFGKKMIQSGTSWIYAHFQVIGDYDKQTQVVLPKMVRLEDEKNITKRIYSLCQPIQGNQSLVYNRKSNTFEELIMDIYDISEPRILGGLVDNIKFFLEQNINMNINSDAVEREFNLTYKYMNRLFKAEVGESIKQYYSRNRMGAIARALRSTDDNISNVCRRFGFDDPLYFSKVFKKEFGISPREYRSKIITEVF